MIFFFWEALGWPPRMWDIRWPELWVALRTSLVVVGDRVRLRVPLLPS